MLINVNDKIYEKIKEYCEYNKIDDIESEVSRILEVGLSIDKYGAVPFIKFKPTKPPIVETTIKNEETDKVTEKTVEHQDEEKPKKPTRRVHIIKT